MNRSEKFVNALQRIGFPEVHLYNPSDFDSFCAEKELLPFLDCICSLTESNALTSDELSQYASLSASEIEEINALEGIDGLLAIESKKSEIKFLQDHLALIEKQNDVLEKEKDMWKLHESRVLEEHAHAKKRLLQAKKAFQVTKTQKNCIIEKKLHATMTLITDAATELNKSIILKEETCLPMTNAFMEQLKQYLETEKKLFSRVNMHFKKQIQLQDEKYLSIENVPLEFKKELFFFKSKLEASKRDNFKFSSEVVKLESVLKFYEKYEENNLQVFSSEKVTIPSQLRTQLDDALARNKKLQDEERELNSFLYKAIADHIESLCKENILLEFTQKLTHFQSQNKSILLPTTMLLQQRLRLEYLMHNIGIYWEKILDLKSCFQNVSDYLEKEQKCLSERKEQYEEKIALHSPATNEYLSGNSPLLSLYKIIEEKNLENLDAGQVTLQDLLKKLEMLASEDVILNRKKEENQLELESAEKYKFSMERIISGEYEDNPNWLELDRTLNVELNNLKLKLAALQEKLLESLQSFEKKKELLKLKRNLSMARNLFVYALTDAELFHKSVDDIKRAMLVHMKES